MAGAAFSKVKNTCIQLPVTRLKMFLIIQICSLGHKVLRILLLLWHKIQQFCGMEPVKSYFCFDVVHNPDIEKYLKGLDNHLHTYVLNDRLA